MSKTDTTVKSVIRQASGTLHGGIDKTESFALVATDRVEAVFGQARSGIENAQELGLTVANAVGVAGRTAFNGVKEINTTLAAHGKAALDDMVEVGQKSLGVTSLMDLVALHTEYATRRLNAGFEAANAVNSLAHANTVALWSPIADALRGAAVATDAALPKAAKAKTARKA